MSHQARNPYAVVVGGATSLAIAMGIGRFAFTPILPMMLHDGVLGLGLAGGLATANYVGYLAGAVAAMVVPRKLNDTVIVRSTLVLTVLLTAMMALPSPSAWIALRFLAGVVSAIGFIFTAGWCLAELAATPGSLGSAIFTGPGVGIALSGVAASAMTGLGLRGSTTWLAFALLSAIVSVLIWRVFRSHHKPAEAFSIGSPTRLSGKVPKAEMPLFALAYGLAGFGYIITATYLPVIARTAIPHSPLLTIFWPMFGLAAACGSLLAASARKTADARLYLATAYVVQAIGVALSVTWRTEIGLATSSALVGLPFTAISFFAMSEVRRIRTAHQARYMGLLTAVYAVGQILGPPTVGLILSAVGDVQTGFDLALGIASCTLLVGAATYGLMIVLWPTTKRNRTAVAGAGSGHDIEV